MRWEVTRRPSPTSFIRRRARVDDDDDDDDANDDARDDARARRAVRRDATRGR
jgi:hypothetical protein|tara:strand:- start:189 stop:347 length:159 start_codon:yes stop_codon:yes gene_type:complete